MSERVVVGWDGSPAAAVAAEWAARRQHGTGRIELVRVLDPAEFPPDWLATGGTPEAETEALEAEARRLAAAHPSLTITTRTLPGHRETELERLAAPDSLLVVGTQPRIGPRLRFRFSLAARLAARARGPVAVVPGDAAYRAGGPVVVGVDGSAASVAAARLAAGEAVRHGVGLIAVHAWWEATDWEAVLPMEAGVHDSFEGLHRTVLAESMTAVEREFPLLEIEQRLVHAPGVAALLAAADGALELVVGRHTRVVARDLLLGSVSRRLLLDTWVPVVVAGAVETAARDTLGEPALRAGHV